MDLAALVPGSLLAFFTARCLGLFLSPVMTLPTLSGGRSVGSDDERRRRGTCKYHWPS